MNGSGRIGVPVLPLKNRRRVKKKKKCVLYDSMWPPFPQHPLASSMQKQSGAHGSELNQPAASAQNSVHKAGLRLLHRQQREIKPSLGCFCILGNSENLPPTRSNFLPPSREHSPVNYQRAPSLSPEPNRLRAESSWLPTQGKVSTGFPSG